MQRHAGEVISHNPCLILAGEEGSFTLRDSFFLGTDKALTEGPGVESLGKNNSGVYYDTLIGDYHVYIPEQHKERDIAPDIESPWRIYEISKGLSITVFDGKVRYREKKGLFPQDKSMQLGIIMVLPSPSSPSQELINQIARENLPTHLAGLESYALSKLTQESFQELKRLLPRNTKINSIAHDSEDYKRISFSRQETNELIESLDRTPSGKEIIKLLVFGKTLKFPENCESVMKGKRIYFNQASALDRWIIGGTDDCSFTARDRTFYSIEGSEEDAAPGWQGSAIQHFPGGPIINDLGEPAHYLFLSSSTSPRVEESEDVEPRRGGAGAGAGRS